ncbi:MAG: YceI family protein [Pseudomonadota bacterium]
MKFLNALLTGIAVVASVSAPALAETYNIDTAGAHASINFRISHLGYSWLEGRFDSFEGSFSFDENDPTASSVAVTIDTSSVNSNHAERDNHLRSADFLDVGAHPQASFTSKRVEQIDETTIRLIGDLTLRGMTKPIEIDAKRIGGGKDPWGNYRQGFVGTTSILLADFGIPFDLGPASKEVFLTFNVEGIKQ